MLQGAATGLLYSIKTTHLTQNLLPSAKVVWLFLLVFSSDILCPLFFLVKQLRIMAQLWAAGWIPFLRPLTSVLFWWMTRHSPGHAVKVIFGLPWLGICVAYLPCVSDPENPTPSADQWWEASAVSSASCSPFLLAGRCRLFGCVLHRGCSSASFCAVVLF